MLDACWEDLECGKTWFGVEGKLFSADTAQGLCVWRVVLCSQVWSCAADAAAWNCGEGTRFPSFAPRIDQLGRCPSLVGICEKNPSWPTSVLLCSFERKRPPTERSCRYMATSTLPASRIVSDAPLVYTEFSARRDGYKTGHCAVLHLSFGAGTSPSCQCVHVSGFITQ